MIEKILQQLAKSYKITDIYGVVLSSFNENGDLIASQWTLQTTKSIEQLIPILYNALLWSQNSHSFVVDIVKDVVEQTDKEKFVWLDMSMYGICIVGSWTSGILLPWTTGISSSKDALTAVKKKYAITGKIRLYSFTTDRVVVT